MDDNFQGYLNRIARLTSVETYRFQLHNIQNSPKFRSTAAGPEPLPFPGYSVISPPWGDQSSPQPFYQVLADLQKQLQAELGETLITVPPASFHVTIADLTWDQAFLDAQALHPRFETHLQAAIGSIFAHPPFSPQRPWSLQALGCLVLPRALAVALIPSDEQIYEEITQLRRAIYQDSRIITLGIEQQYGITAHVTLGYFGAIPPDLDRHHLSSLLMEVNRDCLVTAPPLTIPWAQLHKFDDMTRYYRQPDWPSLTLG